MKIQQLLTSAGGNFARPTKFNVMVNPPGDTSGPIMDILCKSVTLPEISHEPIELTYKGHKIKVPGRTNQAQTITLVFYVDEFYNNRNIFESWMNNLDEHYYVQNGFVQTPPKLGTISLSSVDYFEKGNVETHHFENVYPVSIGDLEYSSSDKDTILELSVTFAYYRSI